MNYVLYSLRTVERWTKWFWEGREDVVDEETAENIRHVQNLTNDDPSITIDELEAEIVLSHETIQRQAN